MLLDAITKTIEITVDATATTTESPVVVEYTDLTTATFLPVSTDTVTAGTTVVTIVLGPSLATQRQVKEITVYNADTAAHVYTFKHNDSGTKRTIFVSPSIAAGQTLSYRYEIGWVSGTMTGPAGVGVPIGGTAGQVLTKIDSTNYNTQWSTPLYLAVTGYRLLGRYDSTTGSAQEITLGDGLLLAGNTLYIDQLPGANVLYDNTITGILVSETVQDAIDELAVLQPWIPSGPDIYFPGGFVGIGTAPSPFAALEIASTVGALLIPRMTTTQKNALTALAGMIVYDTTLAEFDGYTTAWRAMSTLASTQAQQEASTSTNTYVAPFTQQFHPSAAKCWGFVTVSAGTPTLAASYNMTSISDTGPGLLTFTINVDFSSASWCAVCSIQRASTALTVANIAQTEIRNAGIAAGTLLIECWDDTAVTHNQVDPTSWSMVGFGDQA